MPSLSRRSRWAVPVAVAVAVGLAVSVDPLGAGASPALPHRTPAQVLAAVAGSGVTPLSGTVQETARLGLPAVPGGHGSTASLQSLVAGTHTARVWSDGPRRARFALLGDVAESDVVRNGRDVWVWSSRQGSAQHVRLPAGGHAARDGSAAPVPATPQQAARQVLDAVDPTTAVSVDGTARVAGRPAYQLVLRPRDTRSLVGRVQIAVDGKTSVPLSVQVYAKGGDKPAFETGFTSVDFSRPDASTFRFSPPPGATVTQGGPKSMHGGTSSMATPPSGHAHGQQAPTVVGSGWTAVAVLRGVHPGAVASESQGANGGGNGMLQTLLDKSRRVTGSFGSGRVVRTALVSALLTDDGRVLVGAVPPSVLEHVASTPEASGPTP